MIRESRSVSVGRAVSAGQVERELARLRMNQDGTLGARASVLNLISVTDEESAPGVTQTVSELAGHYPSRAILMISDPDEEQANLEVELTAFCGFRGAAGTQVCTEQITLHVEGPPANHLESLAGPLLIPDIPVFLWYANGEIPPSPRCEGMAHLADRLILDSGAAGDCEAFLRDAASLLQESDVPALGDLQWAALSPWRSLFADLFAPPEQAGELEKMRRAEILHHSADESQALLFAGWLSGTLGWRPESAEDMEEGRAFHFVGPSGEVTVELVPSAGEVPLSQVRLYTKEFTFAVSRHGELTDVCSTVKRDDELLAERTVHLGPSGADALLGEELKLLGRDQTYEAALRMAVRMLDV